MQRINTPWRWLLVSLLLSFITAVTYYQLSLRQSVKIVKYPIQRTVKYSFTVKNPNQYPTKKSELWIYAPVKKSAFQQLDSLTSNHPYHILRDDQGNDRMVFVIDGLPPYASKTISVTTSLRLSNQGNLIDDIKSEEYLNNEKLIGMDNPAIQKIAHNLKAGTLRDTADKIYNWITKNIKKTGYAKNDVGAVQALANKSGDCTEFMYLFSSLARTNGIPTRNIAGFVAMENRIIRPADYHNWNEVYIDGVWYLIDTDKQVFMEKSSDYIAVRLINDSFKDHSMGAQSFFASTQDIQVSMN